MKDILPFLIPILTAIAGVVAIFGGTYKPKKEVPEIPGTGAIVAIKRVWIRLTRVGLIVLVCALVLCVTSIILEILQAKETNAREEHNKDWQSNTLQGISTTLTNVHRIVSRFESFSITAVYDLPLSNLARGEAANLCKQLTNGTATTYNDGTLSWSYDLDDFLADKKLTDTIRTELRQLLTPAVLAEIYPARDSDKEVFRALAPHGTNIPVIEWAPPAQSVTFRWEVDFPKSLWNQSRQALVAEDLCNSWLQVGFVASPDSAFAYLKPKKGTISFDEIDFPLTDFQPTAATLEEKRRGVRSNDLNGRKNSKTTNSGKRAIQTQQYVDAFRIPGHEDAQLGTVICTHQAKLQLMPAK